MASDSDETQRSRKFDEITDTLRRQRVDLERLIKDGSVSQAGDIVQKLAELRERAEKTRR